MKAPILALSFVSILLAVVQVFSESTITAYIELDSNGNPYVTTTKPTNWVIQATFEEKIDKEGWTYLYLESNPVFPDEVQAYSAGYLEGFLTHQQINQSFYNQDILKYEPTEQIKDFIVDNYNYIDRMVTENQNETYWYQAGLMIYQIKGMEDGYLANAPKVSRDIDPMGIFWMYNWDLTELTDLQLKFAKESNKAFGSGSCSAMIKFTGDDIVASHVTWSEYSSMLRTLKKHKLPFKSNAISSETIPGSEILESSYPGIIHSVDDYYVTSEKLVVIETTNDIQNDTLYDFIQPIGAVPYFLRVSLANRMSQSGANWTATFTAYNSGTYNNQWMVVDYKQFTPNQPIKDETLYILEQMPGTVVSKDLSYLLNENQKAWTSYNVPYFQEINDINNYTTYINLYGPFFSHDYCPRANIFRAHLDSVVNVETGMDLMRYNDYQDDPYAKANCTPLAYSAENGISARCDLNPMTQKCKIAAEGPRCHGATDLKIVNSKMVHSQTMIAISGPTKEQQPAFDWSKVAGTACEGSKHEGHPTRFEFKPVLVDLFIKDETTV